MKQPIYLDTNILIYVVEGPPNLQAKTQEYRRVPMALVTSRLSLAECLVRPLQRNDQRLVATYRIFLEEGPIRMVSIHDAILEKATVLRAEYRFTIPDAIHIATAKHLNCGTIVSNDTNWKKYTDIPVVDFMTFLAESQKPN